MGKTVKSFDKDTYKIIYMKKDKHQNRWKHVSRSTVPVDVRYILATKEICLKKKRDLQKKEQSQNMVEKMEEMIKGLKGKEYFVKEARKFISLGYRGSASGSGSFTQICFVVKKEDGSIYSSTQSKKVLGNIFQISLSELKDIVLGSKA